MSERRAQAAAHRPGEAPAGARRRAFSTRLRILGWYIGLMGLTLIVGLLVQRAVLLAQLDDEVDAQLRQEIAELQQLTQGNNPETGEPFGDDIPALFDTFLSRNIPQEGEALFTLIDGRPHASTVAPLQLLDDPAIVDRWSAITEPERADIETEAGPVRYLAVPVLTSARPGAGDAAPDEDGPGTPDDGGADGEPGVDAPGGGGDSPPGNANGDTNGDTGADDGGDADSAENSSGVFVVAMFMDQRLANTREIMQTGILIYGSAFVLASAIAWFAAGRVLRPIRDLTGAAQSISESNWSDRIDIEGDDEIARLGRTFNEMLDRLEEAFATQRRLIDDAGHELRTPITIVRGHLELLSDDQADREETMRLVMDELDRMSRMVEDLLLLAKAEQPDFLHRQPIDVDEFMDEIAFKAHALSDRGWAIEAAAPTVMVADRQRLTQAMMNLCRNAIEHTPPGTEVALGSDMRGSVVHLWVTDAGPGIEPADQGRIFERFARGHGPRRSEGAGLGLAITATIAEAHGGSLRLRSSPGAGATFTLMLPVTPEGEESDAPDPDRGR